MGLVACACTAMELVGWLRGIACCTPMLRASAAAAAGAVLELVRDVATALAADGRRVKVSVQQALGQGVFQASRWGGVVAGWGRVAHARTCLRCPCPCLLASSCWLLPRCQPSKPDPSSGPVWVVPI